MKSWQVQEAKMQLSELISMAKSNPQLITLRGNPEVVVISTKFFNKLSKEMSIFDIMQKFPDKNLNFELSRSRDKKTRKISL